MGGRSTGPQARSLTCAPAPSQPTVLTGCLHSWERTIKIERLVDAEPGALYPRLIEASGRCPPEDVGGPWGYAEMLEAIGDKKHERHVEIREWLGEDFDPKIFDPEPLKADVAALAKRWTRKPVAKKPRPA